jgi:hypothetical protein
MKEEPETSFTLHNRVLYKVESNKSFPPDSDQNKLFLKFTKDTFGGKVHSVLSHHYWQSHMRADLSS